MYTLFSHKTSHIRPYFGSAPQEGGWGMSSVEKSKNPDKKIDLDGENKRQQMIRDMAKLGVQAGSATEEAKKGKLHMDTSKDKIASNAYMHIFPETGASDPVAVAKIRAFIEDSDNLTFLEEQLQSGNTQGLKERIGISLSKPKLLTLHLEDGSEAPIGNHEAPQVSTVPLNKPEDLGMVTITAEEKSRILKDITKAKDAELTYHEAVVEATVANEKYESSVQEYREKFFHDEKEERKKDEGENKDSQKKGEDENTMKDTPSQDSIDRRSRMEKMMQSELDGTNREDVQVAGNSKDGYHLETENHIPIDESGYNKKFPTEAQASWAERRYELFSEPPLDGIRGQGPDYIDKIKQIPEIEHLWNSNNPNEPFTAKGLRRLLLVGLLKKIDPEGYGKLSYSTIVHNQSQSLSEQFQGAWERHPIAGIRNTGEEGVKNMLAIVMNPEIWKNPDGKGRDPNNPLNEVFP